MPWRGYDLRLTFGSSGGSAAAWTRELIEVVASSKRRRTLEKSVASGSVSTNGSTRPKERHVCCSFGFKMYMVHLTIGSRAACGTVDEPSGFAHHSLPGRSPPPRRRCVQKRTTQRLSNLRASRYSMVLVTSPSYTSPDVHL